METTSIDHAARNEKTPAMHQDHDYDLHHVKTEEDVEAPIARGVDLDAIPHQYWLSYKFLGSAFSIVLLAVSLYINFALPVCSNIHGYAMHLG